MTGKAFHIIISKDKLLLNWGSQTGIPYRMASGMEKDRLIARILHKILNLRLSVENGGVLGKDEFRVLGGTLFKLLFNDDALKVNFSTFYREALGSPNERYRLILEFEKDAEEMAVLPWEYLFYEEDEVQEAFLSAHPKKCIDVIRKLPFKGNWLELDKTAQQIEPPLQVLVIAANPDSALFMDELTKTIDYFQDLEKRFNGKMDIEFIVQPEMDIFEKQLQQVIQNGAFFPHIIHFIGRARMDGENGQLCFVKRNGEGKFDENWISDDAFAGYFEEWRRLPHLVVLHTSDSTPIGNYHEDKGVAIRLAKKGVPFVLALQNPTPEWMAEILIEKLYESLLEGFDIANALTEARFFLARKLVDINGRKYDNYEHKVFGSAVLFTSVLQPFALAKEEAPPQISSTPADAFKVCPNHPQIKFIPSENRCSLCGSSLLFPSQLEEKKAEISRSAEVKMTETITTETSTATVRVTAESPLRSAAPMMETLTTAGRTTSTTTISVENTKLVSIKKYFKKLIAKDLEEAFKELDVVVAFESTEAYNGFSNIYGQLNKVKKEYEVDGILDDKEAELRFNKVRLSLLGFIDGLKVLDIEGTYFSGFDKT